MGGRHREAIEENTMEELNEPNFVTLSRVQNKPILPPVISMGSISSFREAFEEDTKIEVNDYDEDEDDDEGFVEGTILEPFVFSKTPGLTKVDE